MYCIVDMYVCARGLVRWISVHWILSPFQNSFCTVQCVRLLNKQLHILYSLVLNGWTFCTVYYDYNCVQKLGPLGTLSTLQTLKSPVPWLPEKRIHRYNFIYILPSVLQSTSSWPTPSNLQNILQIRHSDQNG